MSKRRGGKDDGAKGRDLVLVLGDQLSVNLASLEAARKTQATVLLAEVAGETSYVRHHKKKIAFIFSAMRHFAEGLKKAGWNVDYIKLDDDGNSGSFSGECQRAIERHGDFSRVIVTEPGEWRVLQELRQLGDEIDIPLEIVEDDRFLCSRREFADWADGRKLLRMEDFYREMRKKTGMLMEADGSPAGGRWNFDSENRKPAKQDLFMPRRLSFKPDETTKDVLDLVAKRFGNHFGDLEPFEFAVTADDAQKLCDAFMSECLAKFGDYQDAMLTGEPHLYHSLLSFYINAGLLDPLDVCRRAERAYQDGAAPLNAVEGFIRQIIGWREYVRGIYWLKMPDYVENNFFDNARSLPDFYWTAETGMRCLKEVVSQTREQAYAHHIQRLMITGNFALIAGIAPKEVHEWYLVVYADAYEWVELPNTLGMSQFADGGLLGSKPYASSANYINKMSDYCKNCRYDHKTKTEEDSCPFNFLYWDFLARNEKKLSDNRRMGMVYGTWRKMDANEKRSIRAKARAFLDEVAPVK